MGYRFESILRLKTQLENIKKAELGKEIDILNRYLENKEKLIKNLKSKFEEIKIASTDFITPEFLKSYNQYISLIKKKINIQDELIKYQESIVEQKRQETIKYMIEKKKYEKLKERHIQLELLSQRENEKKEIDTVVTYKQYVKLGEDK
ncbi:flagellar export protein FliJ [Caldicellulosiruptoraceae bacterium PP1]